MFNKSYNQLQQPVIALPTVTSIERNPENDQYLLLGCDGVFDVFMTSQLVQYTTNRFTVYKTVKEVALDLVDTSFARGTFFMTEKRVTTSEILQETIFSFRFNR